MSPRKHDKRSKQGRPASKANVRYDALFGFVTTPGLSDPRRPVISGPERLGHALSTQAYRALVRAAKRERQLQDPASLTAKARGEQNARSKLTSRTVREIRKAAITPRAPRTSGEREQSEAGFDVFPSARELAKRYGISAQTVTSIVNGDTWRHILTESELERLRKIAAIERLFVASPTFPVAASNPPPTEDPRLEVLRTQLAHCRQGNADLRKELAALKRRIAELTKR